MQNKNKIIAGLLVFVLCGCAHQSPSAESWIDYNGLSNINVGISQSELEKSLGEPLLILGDNEDGENNIYLFYNYHVKRYLSKNNQRSSFGERRVLIKFIFENDTLVSWEEDNITLNMAKRETSNTSFIKYLNLFLNLILIGAVFGGT